MSILSDNLLTLVSYILLSDNKVTFFWQDPLSHVVLSLQLLRTFSHFPENLVVMVSSQATPAVLGCMAVYLEVTEIQQYGLDILAKIATYRPKPAEKVSLD